MVPPPRREGCNTAAGGQQGGGGHLSAACGGGDGPGLALPLPLLLLLLRLLRFLLLLFRLVVQPLPDLAVPQAGSFLTNRGIYLSVLPEAFFCTNVWVHCGNLSNQCGFPKIQNTVYLGLWGK